MKSGSFCGQETLAFFVFFIEMAFEVNQRFRCGRFVTPLVRGISEHPSGFKDGKREANGSSVGNGLGSRGGILLRI